MTSRPLKYAFLKKKNRRIKVIFLQDDDGNHSVMIETKRLIDFKSRKIQTWNGLLGMDTFNTLAYIFDMLRDDSVYKKFTNRELGQIQKDKFQCSTNIEYT